MISIDLKASFKDSIDTLAEMESALQQKAISRALTPAVATVRDAVRRNIRIELYKTGSLYKSIGRRKISKTAKQRLGIPAESVAIIIGPSRNPKGSDNKTQFIKTLVHEFGSEKKNIKPTRFLSRALESTEGAMQQAFFEGLEAYLNKITE